MAKQVENKIISIELFEKQIQYFIRQAAKTYEQVLKVQEDDILELQNMYQYQTIQEYIEMLKEWVIKFNELIGEEFDDYKNKQKVQQAVGYENEKHFMKTFKAICGVSPTEYRKNILLKG